MSPSEVKRYLQARGYVPMVDLVNRFGCEAEAMSGVLDFWIRKGRVRRIETAGEACASSASCRGCSGGCGQTSSFGAAVYSWVEDGPLRTVLAVSAVRPSTG